MPSNTWVKNNLTPFDMEYRSCVRSVGWNKALDFKVIGVALNALLDRAIYFLLFHSFSYVKNES